eukprot:COSAG05_NODE_121_length_17719_cov_168.686266_2_plen_141_part_00
MQIDIDPSYESNKAASLDATHSPRRVTTFCGAIAGIPRTSARERRAGEPHGRLLREIGACEDFEMRYVARRCLPPFRYPQVAPVFGLAEMELYGMRGGAPRYVDVARSRSPHLWHQRGCHINPYQSHLPENCKTDALANF